MIQTKADLRRAPRQPGQRVVGVSGADLGLDVRHRHPPPRDEPAGRLDPRLQGCQLGLRFERIAGRHQPPDPVEAEPRQREAGNKRVALVRRIERAAEEANAHARRERGQARYSGHASACWASSSA